MARAARSQLRLANQLDRRAASSMASTARLPRANWIRFDDGIETRDAARDRKTRWDRKAKPAAHIRAHRYRLPSNPSRGSTAGVLAGVPRRDAATRLHKYCMSL